MDNQRTLLIGAKIFNGPELTLENNLALLIQGGKIEKTGSASALRSQHPDAVIVDYTGKYILPGLIDCHNHLSLDCALENYLARMNSSETDLTVIATKTLKTDLESGVTTARCVGDRFFIDVYCRQAVKEGFVDGPRLKVSGIGMRASHGHGFVGMPFDGEQALRQAVRSNLKQGVDWIKFYSTGTAPASDGQIISYYGRQEIAAVIEEAHHAGVPVTAHCIGGQGLLDCLDLEIDCIEHAYYVDLSDVDALARSGTMVCLTPSEYFTDKPNMPLLTKALFQKNRPCVRQSMEMIAANGIPFVLGTDGMHGELAMEAQYAVTFGADPRFVLHALTIRAARYLKISHETGSIEAGKMADLLIVKEDPVMSMLALKKITQVYQNGKPILT